MGCEHYVWELGQRVRSWQRFFRNDIKGGSSGPVMIISKGSNESFFVNNRASSSIDEQSCKKHGNEAQTVRNDRA